MGNLFSLQFRGIAFDCYGTLLRIVDLRRPYQRLARLAGAPLDPSPMIAPLSLADVIASNSVPINITKPELAALQADLEAEIASVVPIGTAVAILRQLRRRGYRLGIASNLAAPYAEPVRRHLGDLVDAQVFSFDVGATKPSRIMYDELRRRLDLTPSEVLMIGDSMSNDYDGAIAAGLNARHLSYGVAIDDVLQDLL